MFPREELSREPAVAGQVQRQRASAQQSTALPHAGLRQPREDLCPGRIVRGADNLERSLGGKTDCCQQSGMEPRREKRLLPTIWNGASAGKRTVATCQQSGTEPRRENILLPTVWNGASAGKRTVAINLERGLAGKTDCNHSNQAQHYFVLPCAI